MVLRAGYLALAQRLQEAASSDDLSTNDIRTRLSDSINDQFRGTGNWAYYIDHFGDAESGDVVYYADSNTFMAPYEISGGPGAAKCLIDFESAENVVPRTIYEVEADEEDHFAAIGEALKTAKVYTALPLYERFISKSARDNADSSDFAGKGKSFPILKAGDVMAAMHSLGRAGSDNYSTSVIRANIIKIAKRKGFPLPKSAQDEKTSEAGFLTCGKCDGKGKVDDKECPSCDGKGKIFPKKKESLANTNSADRLTLVESAVTTEKIVLREARADYPIKLIAPGKGSSAYYPAEVLERDGPKIFGKGTQVFLNHPTAAEESARPEGDVKNLAGVLTEAAHYESAGSQGPGLYGRMKVFADHAQTVEEKAPYVGMSIRAYGEAEKGKQIDGLPVLKSLTAAESVDVVTRAGAGGMILQEAARAAESNNGGAVDMTTDEVKRLIEAETAGLRKRAIAGDAIQEATRLLKTYPSLPEVTKERILESVIADVPVTDKRELDMKKLAEAVKHAAQREGEYLSTVTGGGRVTGMGIAPVSEAKAKSKTTTCADCKGEGTDDDGEDCDTCNGTGKVVMDDASESARGTRIGKTELREAESIFSRLTNGNTNAAKAAVQKGVAA
jgi:rubrerythrin